jgi:hypothetical protein
VRAGSDKRERALRCGGALERGDGAALEPLAQLGEAHGGVGADTCIQERAFGQAASKGQGRPLHKLLTQKQAEASVL